MDHDPILRRLALCAIALAALAAASPLAAEEPNNPPPCTNWQCVGDASVTKVTITGPTELKVGEDGTWTATAETRNAKQVCVDTGAERDCPVKSVKWSMSAGDQTSNTNTITRSWLVPGTYKVVATGEPEADCCPGSGTEGELEVEVKCKAGDETHSFAWDGDPIKQLAKELEEKLQNGTSYVKDVKCDIVGGGTITAGLECCPGASFATPYEELKLDIGIDASAQFFIPGLSQTGLIWIHVHSPGWIGKPWEVFNARIQWGAGAFGGAEGTARVGDTFKYTSECGNCATIGFNGELSGIVGVAGKGDYKVWFGSAIGGNEPDTEGGFTISFQTALTGEFHATLKLGSAPGCSGHEVHGCFKGITIEFVIELELSGLGSWEYKKEYGPWAGNCE